ncbi:Ger(x)C family spore germination protein [Bacillus sp. V33-4]|uniref:Ger(x)C family spore germination protein n=1 Tax=Bacillus sp. V33-4 TaxID=2054169 RepID=UPI000C781DE5|nr:Ger(x)C family spore germination protein [Bacillus sp. V33-4]PLR80599.1 spore gernimation protein [Bacillus sp. V33-4]
MGFFKKTLFIFPLLCVGMIAGCSPFVEDNIVEEIAPVTFLSMTKGEQGKLKVSTLVPPVTKEEKHLLSLEIDLLKQGRKNFNSRYYRELKLGQLRALFFSQELAEQEVLPIINTILADPDVSPRLYLVIVKGNFDEYLKSQMKKQKDLDYFLYRMLKRYERDNQGEFTIVNVHQFLKEARSPFVDPVLPVFKADKKDLKYEGTGFFRNDKLAGMATSEEEEIFQLLDEDRYINDLPILPLSVSLGHVRSQIDVQFSKDHSSMDLIVDLRGRIDEYRGRKNIHNDSDFKELNREIEKYLQKNTVELIKKMQALKVDPLGVGTFLLEPFDKPMPEKKWLDHWENMKVDVRYNVYIEPLTI